MPVLGIGMLWVGYSLFIYGYSQTQGDNFGLLDLMLPGRWAKAQNNPKDSGGGSVTTQNTAPATSNSTRPATLTPTPGYSGAQIFQNPNNPTSGDILPNPPISSSNPGPS